MFDLVSTLISAGAGPRAAVHAFTANLADNSVSALSVANPASMTFVSELADATYLSGPTDMAIDRKAKVAWVRAELYLTAVDISNPASMSRLGSYNLGATAFIGKGVALDTDHALAVTFDHDNAPHQLLFLSTANPASIALTGSANLNSAAYYGVAFGLALDVTNSVAYCLTTDGANPVRLYAVDYSTPASPAVLDSLDLAGADPTAGGIALHANGDTLFVSHGAGDFSVIDVSNPAALVESYTYSSLFTLGGSGKVTYLPGDVVLVCASSDDAMKTLNVANLASVTVIDTESGATYLDNCQGHAVDPFNGTIFVAGGDGDDLTSYTRSGGTMTFAGNYTSATEINFPRAVALL